MAKMLRNTPSGNFAYEVCNCIQCRRERPSDADVYRRNQRRREFRFWRREAEEDKARD